MKNNNLNISYNIHLKSSKTDGKGFRLIKSFIANSLRQFADWLSPQWHHLVHSYDVKSKKFEFYIDGVLVISTTND